MLRRGPRSRGEPQIPDAFLECLGADLPNVETLGDPRPATFKCKRSVEPSQAGYDPMGQTFQGEPSKAIQCHVPPKIGWTTTDQPKLILALPHHLTHRPKTEGPAYEVRSDPHKGFLRCLPARVALKELLLFRPASRFGCLIRG